MALHVPRAATGNADARAQEGWPGRDAARHGRTVRRRAVTVASQMGWTGFSDADAGRSCYPETPKTNPRKQLNAETAELAEIVHSAPSACSALDRQRTAISCR